MGEQRQAPAGCVVGKSGDRVFFDDKLGLTRGLLLEQAGAQEGGDGGLFRAGFGPNRPRFRQGNFERKGRHGGITLLRADGGSRPASDRAVRGHSRGPAFAGAPDISGSFATV